MQPEYLGFCDVNTKVIEINKDFVVKGRRIDVDDLIRHEIAHALAGNTEETRNNPHGKAWKKQCDKVGAKKRLAIPSPI
jgi:predicted SprT family Zn-dependent metalloprotease